MKKHLQLLYFLAGAIMYIALVSSSAGRAAAAGQGNTGAPGDSNSTCVTCHNNSQIQVETIVEMFDVDGNSVTEYMHGQAYRVRVSVNRTGGPEPSARGFQMISLDEDENPWNGFFDEDANTQLVTLDEMGSERQYAEHKGPNANNEFFETMWQAPEEGSGPITFYAGGNGVNGNGATSGDGAALGELTVTYSPFTSSTDIDLAEISAYPNPFVDFIYVEIPEGGNYDVSLNNIHGNQISASKMRASGEIHVADLASGAYILQISDQNGQSTSKKFIKMK